MSNTEIDKYMESILQFSKDAKEKYGDNSPEYIRSILCAVYTNHYNIQGVYEKQIAEAVKENNFSKLKSVFYHAAKVKLLPCASSGYDHCDRLWHLLDLLACAGVDNIYRILPEGLPIKQVHIVFGVRRDFGYDAVPFMRSFKSEAVVSRCSCS